MAGELLLSFGDRHWRVRGWQKNLGPDQMRVNVQVRSEAGYHVDTLDVYSAKQRAAFIKMARHARRYGQARSRARTTETRDVARRSD